MNYDDYKFFFSFCSDYSSIFSKSCIKSIDISADFYNIYCSLCEEFILTEKVLRDPFTENRYENTAIIGKHMREHADKIKILKVFK